MEVGDESSDDLHAVTGSNHKGCAGFKSSQLVLPQIIEDVLQRLLGWQLGMALVGIPLVDMEVSQCQALFLKHHAYPVEAFQSAGAGGAYGDDVAVEVFRETMLSENT